MNSQEVFKIRTKTDFEKCALKIFHLQADQNSVYKKYVEQLGVNPDNVKHIEQIPFLPIEFFKSQKVVTRDKGQGTSGNKIFLSSGTTGMDRSKHYVSDIKLYETSFRKGFELFYGDISNYFLLAFLPSYYENKNSSLLYMVNDLMKNSEKKENRFYKNSEQKILLSTLDKLLAENKKVILFGVSYALLDLTALHPRSLSLLPPSETNSGSPCTQP